MKVGIIQSCFVPWRGYFDFINDVDLFVFLDSVQYTKRDWRNRNRFKVAQGAVWVTVPVQKAPRGQLIQDTLIDYDQNWIEKIGGLLDNSYRRAPYYDRYRDAFMEILQREFKMLSELNITLTHWLMGELGISTETVMSKDLDSHGVKTDLLLDILKTVGASHYLSGPSAKDYLDHEAFRKAGIGLSYKNYEYDEYPQLFHPFDGQVTVIDLLFNCGPKAPDHMKCKRKNETVLS